jgi:hypothetical protein
VPARVVIVLDEPGFAERIAHALKRDGIDATALADPMAAPAGIRRGWVATIRGIITPSNSIYAVLMLTMTLVSVAVGGWAVEIYHSANERSAKDKEAFIGASRAMDSTIAYYVRFIVNEKPVADEAVHQVNSNITKQRQLLRDVSKYLSPSDQYLIKDYGNLLLQFEGAIPSSTDVTHMRGFWESASKLLVTRNAIIQKLQS